MTHEDCAINDIEALPNDLKVTMARLILAGWRFKVIGWSPAGEGLWHVRYPAGARDGALVHGSMHAFLADAVNYAHKEEHGIC